MGLPLLPTWSRLNAWIWRLTKGHHSPSRWWVWPQFNCFQMSLNFDALLNSNRVFKIFALWESNRNIQNLGSMVLDLVYLRKTTCPHWRGQHHKKKHIESTLRSTPSDVGHDTSKPGRSTPVPERCAYLVRGQWTAEQLEVFQSPGSTKRKNARKIFQVGLGLTKMWKLTEHIQISLSFSHFC